MNRLATLLALVLAQAGPAPAPEPPAPAESAATAPAGAPAPPPAPAAEPSRPRPADQAATAPAVPEEPSPAQAVPSEPSRPAPEPAAPTTHPSSKPRVRTPTQSPTTTSTPTSPPRPRSAPEREQVARAALRFFEALLGRRAQELAALCAPTFSFDGRLVSGPDGIRARFGDLFARRDGVAYVLEDLAVLPAVEALARYGKPPARVASLAQGGAWVAVASLSGRPTFLFLERRGGAWVATGMHD